MPVAELGYTDGRGALALRRELTWYAGRVRGALLDPERIVVTTGVSAALGLLARTLVAAGRVRVAVEDPGAYNQWAALRAAGATLVPIPADDNGLRVECVASSGADVVVVAPAHQYPLGGVLSPERRDALIGWARSDPGRIIVEDDYDAEFRFDRKPVATLQGLAPDVVALTNSVSKSIAPGLRLGWLASPATIADDIARRISHECVTPDAVAQHAFARLLATGRHDRIIRARRLGYQRRRASLAAALDRVPGCRVVGAAGGLHLTVLLPAGCDDVELSQRLAAVGIVVPALSEYRLTPGPPGLVASFSNLGSGQAEAVSAALTGLLTA